MSCSHKSMTSLSSSFSGCSRSGQRCWRTFYAITRTFSISAAMILEPVCWWLKLSVGSLGLIISSVCRMLLPGSSKRPSNATRP